MQETQETQDKQKFKVGDKVKIVSGNKSYASYVTELHKAVDLEGKITDIDRDDNDYKVQFNHSVFGEWASLWFDASWLEIANTDSQDLTPHPQAEVLMWIAEGREIEYRSNSSSWQKLHTKENFSVFKSFEYRLKPKELSPVFKWVFFLGEDPTNLMVSSAYWETAKDFEERFPSFKAVEPVQSTKKFI